MNRIILTSLSIAALTTSLAIPAHASTLQLSERQRDEFLGGQGNHLSERQRDEFISGQGNKLSDRQRDEFTGGKAISNIYLISCS
ncbi:MAG: hypothetical protein ACFE0J_12640 [Elainellaceae cyanobacterium]